MLSRVYAILGAFKSHYMLFWVISRLNARTAEIRSLLFSCSSLLNDLARNGTWSCSILLALCVLQPQSTNSESRILAAIGLQSLRQVFRCKASDTELFFRL